MKPPHLHVYRDDVPIEAICIAACAAGLLEVIPFTAPADRESSFALVPLLQERTRSIPWDDEFRGNTEWACGEAFSNACRHAKPGTEVCGLILLLGSGPSTALLLVVENRLRARENPPLPDAERIAFPDSTSPHGWGYGLMHSLSSALRVSVEPGKRLILVLLCAPSAPRSSS